MDIESARDDAPRPVKQQFIAAVSGLLVSGAVRNKPLLRHGNLEALYWARAWHALGLPENVSPAEMEQAITSLFYDGK